MMSHRKSITFFFRSTPIGSFSEYVHWIFWCAARGPVGPAWGSLDDNVMGGVSESSLQIISTGGEDGGPVGAFKGVVFIAFVFETVRSVRTGKGMGRITSIQILHL